MDNNLTKEQLLLLQHNLTYEVYEDFMSMFDQDESLPEDKESRGDYILETMKEHPFWGEIMGWGDKRVYKHICLPNLVFPDSESESESPSEWDGPYNIYSLFKGKSKKELVKFLDEYSKTDDLLVICPFHERPELLLPVD